MYITLDQFYMGRDKLYPEALTPELRANAKDLLERVHNFLVELKYMGPIKVSSGFRPAAINAKVKGAAKKSNHMICKAVDIADPKGELGKLCAANEALLIKHGLYLEDPKFCPTWTHLQTTPTKSGKRIFKP